MKRPSNQSKCHLHLYPLGALILGRKNQASLSRKKVEEPQNQSLRCLKLIMLDIFHLHLTRRLRHIFSSAPTQLCSTYMLLAGCCRFEVSNLYFFAKRKKKNVPSAFNAFATNYFNSRKCCLKISVRLSGRFICMSS